MNLARIACRDLATIQKLKLKKNWYEKCKGLHRVINDDICFPFHLLFFYVLRSFFLAYVKVNAYSREKKNCSPFPDEQDS
jgi:hypothetical protein